MRKLLPFVLCISVGFVPTNIVGQAGVSEKTTTVPFHLSKVDYVMLGVADINTTIHFYRDKLGLKVSRQTDDVVFFNAGAILLVVSTAVGKDPGATEIVFSVDHVQMAYQALSRAGVLFEREPHQITDLSWAANFRDPDGHILSVFGPK